MGSPNSENEFRKQAFFPVEVLLGTARVEPEFLTPSERMRVLMGVVEKCKPQLPYVRDLLPMGKMAEMICRLGSFPYNEKNLFSEKLPGNTPALRLFVSSETVHEKEVGVRNKVDHILLSREGKFVLLHEEHVEDEKGKITLLAISFRYLDERELVESWIRSSTFRMTLLRIGEAVFQTCSAKREDEVKSESPQNKEKRIKHITSMWCLLAWLRQVEARIGVI